MIWYEHMYFGANCRKNIKSLKRRITVGKPHPNVFLIVLGQEEHSVLEVIPSVVLTQENYPRESLKVIGAANTKTEAMRVIERIISDVYQEQKDFNVPDYMKHCLDRDIILHSKQDTSSQE